MGNNSFHMLNSYSVLKHYPCTMVLLWDKSVFSPFYREGKLSHVDPVANTKQRLDLNLDPLWLHSCLDTAAFAPYLP